MKGIMIRIDTEFIPAVSLLKLAGVVESGGQASHEIEQGQVTLDGAVLKEKRKKVRPGSTVIYNNFKINVLGENR